MQQCKVRFVFTGKESFAGPVVQQQEALHVFDIGRRQHLLAVSFHASSHYVLELLLELDLASYKVTLAGYFRLTDICRLHLGQKGSQGNRRIRCWLGLSSANSPRPPPHFRCQPQHQRRSFVRQLTS